MLGIDRTAARYTFTAATVLVLLALVYTVRSTLFIFSLALLFAYLISPLVDLLDRALPASSTRTPALALSYVIFVLAVVLVGILIGSRVVNEAKALGTRLPGLMDKWEQPSPIASDTINSLKAELVVQVRTEMVRWSTDLFQALPAAGMKFLSVASNLIFVVIVPVLAFLFLKDGGLIRQHTLDLVAPGPRRTLLDSLLDDTHLLLAHYMRALVLLSLATFVAYAVFFTIMGVPYGVLLAVVAGALEFIPMVGPLTAAAIILLVAGISGAHLLAILIFLVAFRMFQDYFLSPHLMGQGVELHPLLVLFGVFAGGQVAGIAGTFLSVPVLAVARILYLRVRRSRLSAPGEPAVSLESTTPIR
jgi:predicted PurR-regulated permease PerM